MNIVKNNITPKLYAVYHNEKFIDLFNEYELYDLRLQVIEKKLNNIFILFNDERINIDHRGEFSSHPNGFCDEIEDGYKKILAARKNAKIT